MRASILGSRPTPGMRWIGLGVGAFVVQVILVYGLGASGDRERLPLLLPLAHLLLLPFLLRNLSLWGIRLVLMGLLLNLAVMVANGGLMPVEGPAVEAVGARELDSLDVGSPIPGSKNVLLAPEQIRLRALSDVLVLPLPEPFTRAMSGGDMFVVVGVLVAYGEILLLKDRSTFSVS